MTKETEELVLDKELVNQILHNVDHLAKNERILRKTIVELVLSKRAMLLFLKDDEVREYWEKLVSTAKTQLEKRKEAWRLYNIKNGVYERLSPEERRLLGLTKPVKPKGDPV
jgi:hypothetical protein